MLTRIRELLFILTGLAVPLYAFPIARIFGKPLDLATLAAGLFVLTSLPFVVTAVRPGLAVFLAGGVLIPLLVLIPPGPALFSPHSFAISYGHWLLMVGFFVSAFSLSLPESARKRLFGANVIAGVGVALFALYQVIGLPRGWPATGRMLVSFQREPLRLDNSLGYVRPPSVFLEPAWMGGYLVWVLVLSLGLLPALRLTSRAIVLIGSGILLAAILASVSWGTYVDLLIVGLVLSVTVVNSRLVPRKLVLGAAGLLLLLLLFVGLSTPGRRVVEAARVRWSLLTTTPLASDRPPQGLQDSTRIRLFNARHAVQLALQRPLRGVGLGQFAGYAATEGRPRAEILRDAWCGWLAITAEIGLGGPLLLLWALLLTLRAWKRARAVAGVPAFVVPALVAFASIAQVHTASYIDLWWWYPLSVAAVLSTSRTQP